MNAAEREKVKTRRRQLFWYYVDEFTILVFCLIGVMLSEGIRVRAQGQKADLSLVYFDALNVIISGVLAIIGYGALHIQFKYNDRSKPPYIKRAANALMNGIAWRTIMGWTGG